VEWRELDVYAWRHSNRFIESRDLLQEAMSRCFKKLKPRRCPVDVSVLVFLKGVMRSIANQAWEDGVKQQPPTTAFVDAGELTDTLPDANLSSEEYIAREQDAAAKIRMIVALFAKDAGCLTVLEGRMNGLSVEELRTLIPPSDKYENIQLRIDRRIAKAFPDGFDL
jgi:DNA-directed RNA polymerase specialized sigma24 family protein